LLKKGGGIANDPCERTSSKLKSSPVTSFVSGADPAPANVEQSDHGLVGFITTDGWVDNPTFKANGWHFLDHSPSGLKCWICWATPTGWKLR
jgi:hypothetical protein